MPTIFFEYVPDVEIQRGSIFFTAADMRAGMAIDTARAFNRRIAAAIAVYDAGHGVVVAPLRVVEQDHAASILSSTSISASDS